MNFLTWGRNPWGQTIPVHVSWSLMWASLFAGLMFLIAHASYMILSAHRKRGAAETAALEKKVTELGASREIRDWQKTERANERREQALIPPVQVEKGPCKEVVVRGDDVDVFRLPAPMLHEGDGGRYIGTWDLVVSRDPGSNWTNWGIYRFMLHGRRTLTGFPRPTSHLGKIFQERYLPKVLASIKKWNGQLAILPWTDMFLQAFQSYRPRPPAAA